MSITLAQRAAAFGKQSTEAIIGIQYLTGHSKPDQSAQLPLQIQTLIFFMSEWASRRYAGTSRTATVFTNRWTRARHGKTSVCRIRDKSLAFALIRKTQT